MGLMEKEVIDQKTADVDKQLKECEQSNKKKSTNTVGLNDDYSMIKHEFDQVSADRDKILEKKKIVEKKMEDMNNDFELIVYERNKIRNEDEEIEERCKTIRKAFDSLSQKSSQRDLPDSFLERLETIRVGREDILRDDKEIDEENRKLWIEAHTIKDQMFEVSRKHILLDTDNEEIQKLFNEITTERNKLIEKDNLLNGRYQIIHDNIQKVCERRMEVKLQIESLEEDSEGKDTCMQEDLDLIVKQKEFENVFDNWKRDKASILQDNKDLDTLLDDLLKKFELLKEKKQILVDEDTFLQRQSLELNEKLKLNQRRKETAIQEFKEKEQMTNEVVGELELLSSGGEENGEAGRNNETEGKLQHLLAEFEKFKQIKDALRLKDEEITEIFALAKSEFEDLTEENNILTKHQTEIETAYE